MRRRRSSEIGVGSGSTRAGARSRRGTGHRRTRDTDRQRPDDPFGTDRGQRPGLEVGRRHLPDRVTNEDGRALQAAELLRACGTAGEVARDRLRGGRIAGHQPLEAVGFDGRQFHLFANRVVVHRVLYRSSPAGTGMTSSPASGPNSVPSASRRRRRARRVRVLTVPSGQPSRSAISDLREFVLVGEHDHRPFDLGHLGESAPDASRGGRQRRTPPRATTRRFGPGDDGPAARPAVRAPGVGVLVRARPPRTAARVSAGGRQREVGRPSGCARSYAARRRGSRRRRRMSPPGSKAPGMSPARLPRLVPRSEVRR